MAAATIFRAILQYIFLIFITRIVGRRPGKQLTPFEFVLIFYLGGLTLTGMVGMEASMVNAVCQIITITLTYVLVVWARKRSPRVARLFDGTPLMLLEGKTWRADTMRRMRIADDDVMAMARDQGLKTLGDIDTATLERNGEISIIPADDDEENADEEEEGQGEQTAPGGKKQQAGSGQQNGNGAQAGKPGGGSTMPMQTETPQRSKKEHVPVGDSVPKVDDAVAVGEDLEFQRHWWRFEHIVWWFFALVLLADLLGAFGQGPLAKAERRASDQTIDVTYERIERATTPSILTVHPGAAAIHDGKMQLYVSDSVVKQLGNQRISPEPAASILGDGGITYEFPITTTPATIQFALEPSRPGVHDFSMHVPGGEAISGRVVVLP
jgi:uncharacterized membrane protein YcaP (DUF421 family)